MSKDNGGPAFPITLNPGSSYQGYTGEVDGMTLRDYFAAKAMQSFIGNMEIAKAIVKPSMSNDQADAAMAKAAYAQADAMLAERAK